MNEKEKISRLNQILKERNILVTKSSNFKNAEL